MKGYELYSWYEAASWRFALVVGTNRIKTYEEVADPDVCVEGLDALEAQLARLQPGEQVLWSAGRVPGTVLPPDDTVDVARRFCERVGVRLDLAEDLS